ncbi:MAG: hypothetical protein ACLQVF_04335 [Isosphaeraceae bacterium]
MSTRNWVSRGGDLIWRACGFALVLTAFSAAAFANRGPEIDPGLATSATALLSGGLLIIASRRRRK